MEQPTFVVLGSANGSRNLGDEAMWMATALSLRGSYPRSKIITDGSGTWHPPLERVTVLPALGESFRVDASRYPRLSEGFRKFKALRFMSRAFRDQLAAEIVKDRLSNGPRTKDELAWFEAIKCADALIIAGAGAMTDKYSLQGIHCWNLLLGWAEMLGVPRIVLGQGIGPIHSKINRAAATQLVKRAQLLTTRDELSTAFTLKYLAGNPELVVSSRDWAEMLESDSVGAEAALMEMGVLGSQYVCLSVHSHQPFDLVRLLRMRRLVVAVCNEATKRSLKVVFIPNMTGSGHSDDRKLAKRLIKSLKPSVRANCRVHVGQSDGAVVKAIIGRSIGIITTRYHPLIFAFSEGVPAVGVEFDEYYRRKFVGASKNFGVSTNVVNGNSRHLDAASWLSGLLHNAEWEPARRGPGDLWGMVYDFLTSQSK